MKEKASHDPGRIHVRVNPEIKLWLMEFARENAMNDVSEAVRYLLVWSRQHFREGNVVRPDVVGRRATEDDGGSMPMQRVAEPRAHYKAKKVRA